MPKKYPESPMTHRKPHYSAVRITILPNSFLNCQNYIFHKVWFWYEIVVSVVSFSVSVSQRRRAATQTSVSKPGEIITSPSYQSSSNVTMRAPTSVTLSSCQTIRLSVSAYSSAHESQSVTWWPAVSTHTSISSSANGKSLSVNDVHITPWAVELSVPLVSSSI